MRNFFRITVPQNQEENLDSHESRVIFLVTPVKQESAGQAALRNLSELEETPEAQYYQGVLTYIKNLATYVSDFEATFLVYARGVEASDLV